MQIKIILKTILFYLDGGTYSGSWLISYDFTILQKLDLKEVEGYPKKFLKCVPIFVFCFLFLSSLCLLKYSFE